MVSAEPAVIRAGARYRTLSTKKKMFQIRISQPIKSRGWGARTMAEMTIRVRD